MLLNLPIVHPTTAIATIAAAFAHQAIGAPGGGGGGAAGCSACPESASIIKPDTSTASKSDPCTCPNSCSASSSHCEFGAPLMYQFDPLSARMTPYFFIARRITCTSS